MRTSLQRLVVLLTTLLVASPALAAPDYFGAGDGHSGTLNVTAGQNLVVNDYVGVDADIAANATAITVDDASDFQAGDLIMVWQAAGLADPGTADEGNTVNLEATDAGRFEFARIESVNGATELLTLVDPVEGAYDEAVTQVIRVPEYDAANIAATGQVVAQPWNGDTGGIVVFFVNGELANSGSVQANGSGFRGGTDRGDSDTNGCTQLNPSNGGSTQTDRTAQKGEGIVSTRFGSSHRARGNVINAGGGGICHNSGGGAGGHAGPGGQGGRTYAGDPEVAGSGRDVGGIGGVALTYSVTARLTLGGGGGAGQQNNDVGGVGSAGGGVVFVRAVSMSGAGSYAANGADGGDSTGSALDAAGGAGAGGAVVLLAAESLSCGSADAIGGEGGSLTADDHGTGGGGGGGYVLLQSETVTCTQTVAGGQPGTQEDVADPAGASYGAQAGGVGTATVLDSSLALDTDGDSVPDVVEGAPDSDNDGVPDYEDADDDNDGIPTATEGNEDQDGDGIPNRRDADSDNDGIPDVVEAGGTDGGNGVVDNFTDNNNNGVNDAQEATPLVPPNTDGTGPADYLDLDSDGDGLPDVLEVGAPVGSDGQVDGFVDADGNGLHDTYPTVQPNTDGVDNPDFQDTDSDQDGLPDATEAFDTDGDGVADLTPLNADHDTDGIDDQFDVDCPAAVACAGGSTQVDPATLTQAQDANGNGTGDWLETCVDGYITAGEACDDGNAIDTDACSNSCLKNLGEMCMLDPECASAICEDALCSACRDSGSGVDDGCTAGAPVCGGSAGMLSCFVCRDSAAGAGVDDGCSAGAPTCDESAAGGAGACQGCTQDSACDDGNACTTDTCQAGTCTNPAVAVGDPCVGTAGTCSAGGTCVTVGECMNDADCPMALPVCDTSVAAPVCVECTMDGHCTQAGESCAANNTCAAPPGCVTDDDCAATQVCGLDSLCAAPDGDGDGVRNDLDPDDDNDGLLDSAELGGTDLSNDDDMDGVADYTDPDAVTCDDADMNGVCDTLPASIDMDGDGVPNHLDLDADGDGITDVWENHGSAFDANRDGIPDDSSDLDGDGLLGHFDSNDLNARVTTTSAPIDTDGTGGPDHLDLDADGDGITDVIEADGIDANSDGRHDGDDGDGNGLATALDPAEGGTPLNPPDTDGDFAFDFQDVDSDEDGIGDSTEGFDGDEDGASDTPPSGNDDNEDGVDDAFTPPAGNSAPLPDTDGDGIPNFRDPDDDGDGASSRNEVGADPMNPDDSNNDGTPDFLEPNGTVDAGTDAGTDAGSGDAGPAEAGAPEAGAGDAAPDAEAPQPDSAIEPPPAPGPDAGNAGDAGDASSSEPPARPRRRTPPEVGLAGGAGCAAVRNTESGGNAGWAFVALAAIGLLRRGGRRRRERSPRSGGLAWFSALMTVALLSAGLLVSGDLEAQQSGGFNLNRYRPAETALDQFQLSRPDDLGSGRVSLQLLGDYARNPLVLESRDPATNNQELNAVVQDHVVAHAGIAVGLADRLVLFGGIPVNLVMSGEDGANDLATAADGASPGDLWVGGRVRLVGEAKDIAALALQANVTVPFANLVNGDQAYAGDSTVTGHPEILFELRPGIARITTNIGTLIKGTEELPGANSGSELTYGLGVTLSPVKTIDLTAELFGSTTFGQFLEREETPMQALLGGKIHTGPWTVGLAAGPGLTRGVGSPDLRVVGLLGWTTPEKPKPKPVVKIEAPKDTDGDGLMDPEDQCVTEPEDKDEFEDEDGCPDPDNDQDGIKDQDDQCPLEAEDKDEFEDDNGCPDPDNDEDGIPDEGDKCPMDPEDKDEYEDEDGCPDPDNDGDEVLDVDDECPNVPGAKDAKGCPTKIRVEKEQIVILERVEFATGKDRILERSYPILEEVMMVLKASNRLKLIRVEGHTDSRGGDAMNMSLSQRRAASVMNWLVRAGVGAGVLESYGCGEARPIDTNNTRDGRQKNRRVEFHVIDPRPKTPRSTDGCQISD